MNNTIINYIGIYIYNIGIYWDYHVKFGQQENTKPKQERTCRSCKSDHLLDLLLRMCALSHAG